MTSARCRRTRPPAVRWTPPNIRQPIDAEVLSSRMIDKRPIVPPWMRSRAEFQALLVWLSRYGAHVVGYHAPRIPTLYAARLAWRTPAGGWRVARLVFGWVFDREQAPIRADAVRRSSTAEYLNLFRQRNQRVRQRGAVGLVGPRGGPGRRRGGIHRTAPEWVQVAALVLVVGGAGRGGYYR